MGKASQSIVTEPAVPVTKLTKDNEDFPSLMSSLSMVAKRYGLTLSYSSSNTATIDVDHQPGAKVMGGHHHRKSGRRYQLQCHNLKNFTVSVTRKVLIRLVRTGGMADGKDINETVTESASDFRRWQGRSWATARQCNTALESLCSQPYSPEEDADFMAMIS